MYSGSAGGNYAVHITDVNGCTAISPAVPLTVNPLPTAVITPLGSTTFCQGGNVSLMASVNSGNNSYQWYNNSQPVTGATNATWTTNTSGTYSVSVIINATGCDATSSGVNITVNPNPVATYTANGNMQFCLGDTLWLQAQTGSGYNYQWYNNSQPINGETNSDLTVTTSGNYSLNVTDANGCSSASGSPSAVTVFAVPAAPVISQTGNVLTSTPAFSYQWLLNGNLIAGEINQSHFALAGGDYQVEVTNSNGCTAVSDTLTMLTTGSIAVGENSFLNVYPNPFSTQSMIELSVNATASVTLELYTIEGQLISTLYTGVCQPGLNKFDLNPANISAGIYLLKVNIDGAVKVVRLVKQ